MNSKNHTNVYCVYGVPLSALSTYLPGNVSELDDSGFLRRSSALFVFIRNSHHAKKKGFYVKYQDDDDICTIVYTHKCVSMFP